jgi:ribonuclease M5
MDWEPTNNFSSTDLIVNDLSGAPAATKRRAKLGAKLGLGFANAKTFLKRLNHYGVTREEFAAAVAALDEEEQA